MIYIVIGLIIFFGLGVFVMLYFCDGFLCASKYCGHIDMQENYYREDFNSPIFLQKY